MVSSSYFAGLGREHRDPCPHCGQRALVRITRPGAVVLQFQPHFNESVGEYVSSPADFHDALKRKAEDNWTEMGEPSGYSPNYVPVTDPEHVHAIGEGID
jgi:hypothetical protein